MWGSMLSTFGFPKDIILKGKWLKAIPRDNWSPSRYSVVCSIHFPENDIIREDIFLLPDGTVKKIPTKTKLKPDAVPYRKNPEERHNENLARHNVFLEIIEYSFEKFAISYILPGKFTTEKLEKRFGKYRLLGGSNYNVSFDEIINGEKKIRLKHIFRKASGTTFSLSEIQKHAENCCNESDLDWDIPSNTESDKFSYILETEYLNEYQIDESAQIYISGYASFKSSKKLKCNICISLITESKGAYTENEYFNYLQRGGLSVPTDIVKNVLFHMCAIFEKIINDTSIEYDFLRIYNQKDILCHLTLCSVFEDISLKDFYSQCVCGKEYKKILVMLCSIFSNVLLNDYIKKKNNQSSAEKVESKNKKRKLNTFNK